MYRLQCSFAKACEVGEDFVGCLGPLEWPAFVVVRINILVDGLSKRRDAAVRCALECVFGEQAEEAFNEIQPGGVGRCEMQVEARVTNEPTFYRR